MGLFSQVANSYRAIGLKRHFTLKWASMTPKRPILSSMNIFNTPDSEFSHHCPKDTGQTFPLFPLLAPAR